MSLGSFIYFAFLILTQERARSSQKPAKADPLAKLSEKPVAETPAYLEGLIQELKELDAAIEVMTVSSTEKSDRADKLSVVPGGGSKATGDSGAASS